jgi:CrcB protein
MHVYLLVGLGGAVGSASRLWLANRLAREVGDAFPWGILLVNVSGSLLIGFLAALSGSGRLASEGRLVVTYFFMVGVCGGYTTFSTFSLQTLELLQAKQYLAASANVLASVILCLAAVAIGHWLGSLATPGE